MMNEGKVSCTACGCVLLRAGACKRTDYTGAPLPLLPTRTSDTGAAFRVESQMAFENIAFTRLDAGVQYLCCPDCDLGPLGRRCNEPLDGAEYWIVLADRVKVASSVINVPIN